MSGSNSGGHGSPGGVLYGRLGRLTVLLAMTVLPGCEAFWTFFLPIPGTNDSVLSSLLAPAPRLPMGAYDYFGANKTRDEARQLVIDAGLDPNVSENYLRIGLVEISEKLIADGRERFFKQPLGDPSSVGQIFGISNNFSAIDPSTLGPVEPQDDPKGVRAFRRSFFLTLLFRPRFPETNLKVRLERDLIMGNSTFRAGTDFSTGLDVAAWDTLPVGLETGGLSCAVCHASVNPVNGEKVIGMANIDLNIGAFLALSSNTASSFLRFNKSQIDPFDGRFPMTGRRIIDSNGNTVQLPDPIEFEKAIDDIVLTIPPGGFEAAADAATAQTKIPDSFVFGEGGMGWDGGFQIGPFGGLAALSSAVHAFEVNFLGPTPLTQLVAGLDPEVYLGLVLQNSGDPKLRIPDDVKPSQWLKEQNPDTERGALLELPGYPGTSLFSLNSLVFSPPGETFMYSVLALSAFQQSLSVPPNTSLDNAFNLRSGAVLRGAEVFRAADCISCHTPPFFTNGAIIPNDVIKASPRRAQGRRIFDGRLVESKLPSFDQMVPLPETPNFLNLPPNSKAGSNLVLPPGLDNPSGGYKVIGLLGTYLKAPYLHDGSIAATAESLQMAGDGSFVVADVTGIGIPGTTKAGRLLHAGNSLRVLFDRQLRDILLANNGADPTLVVNGVEGGGHEFFVDPAAGFTYQQQSDLVAFLLALDDNPGQ